MSKELIYRYVYLSGSAAPYFEVNPTDGTVRKISFRQLESGKSYDLEVEAVDNRGQTVSVFLSLHALEHFLLIFENPWKSFSW